MNHLLPYSLYGGGKVAKPRPAKGKKRPQRQRLRKSPVSAKAAKPADAHARRSSWPVQEARSNLSALIEAAVAGQPQEITRAGEDAVVVISAKEYKAFRVSKQSLDELFEHSPLGKMFDERGVPEVRHKEYFRAITL